MASNDTITVTVHEPDRETLNKLAGQHPLLTKHRVAQVALRVGLRRLDAESGLLDAELDTLVAERRGS
jgi:hypothetical protein